MEWNGMEWNETERNRMKQNEMDEQTHTDRSALNGAEREPFGLGLLFYLVKARARDSGSGLSPTQPYKNNYNL
jgi:hypothetical protein